jgi:hypothetical protein
MTRFSSDIAKSPSSSEKGQYLTFSPAVLRWGVSLRCVTSSMRYVVKREARAIPDAPQAVDSATGTAPASACRSHRHAPLSRRRWPPGARLMPERQHPTRGREA